MKIDWHKETGQWSIKKSDSEELICRAKAVRLNVPSELVITHGGRHGYLVTVGKLTIQDDVVLITKG